VNHRSTDLAHVRVDLEITEDKFLSRTPRG
jgi:hypothetical protein